MDSCKGCTDLMRIVLFDRVTYHCSRIEGIFINSDTLLRPAQCPKLPLVERRESGGSI